MWALRPHCVSRHHYRELQAWPSRDHRSHRPILCTFLERLRTLTPSYFQAAVLSDLNVTCQLRHWGTKWITLWTAKNDKTFECKGKAALLPLLLGPIGTVCKGCICLCLSVSLCSLKCTKSNISKCYQTYNPGAIDQAQFVVLRVNRHSTCSFTSFLSTAHRHKHTHSPLLVEQETSNKKVCQKNK